MAPMYRIRAALSMNETLRPIADRLLPDKNNKCSAEQWCSTEEWDRFVFFIRSLDQTQHNAFQSILQQNKKSSYLEWRGNYCHTFHSTECDYLIEYTVAFHHHLQKAQNLLTKKYQHSNTIGAKLSKQIPILSFRIQKALEDCQTVLDLVHYKPKFEQLWYAWYGETLYNDWVRTNTRDLYWVASHFRGSDVLPTNQAYKDAQESVKNISQWQPICFDDNGDPSLIFHPSMMDPQDFLIKEEKTDNKWSTIAKFDWRNEHTTTTTVRFHKKSVH